MLFNSLHFAIFLPIVFLLCWLLPKRARWAVLLASGLYFYMSWKASYVVLILFTTFVSYFAAIAMEKTEDGRKKKTALAVAALLCLLVLFVFKYFNFSMKLLESLASAAAINLHPVTLSLLLPVGISFYTFQTLSYVIDVYRGHVRAERHFGKYAAFVTFFPQLVAGPIERSHNLLEQIREPAEFDEGLAGDGMRLMAWGFFKKMVIADNLAVYVDLVYGDHTAYGGFALVLAAVFFAFQIYCDFSGYSDIAVGCGRLFGIRLMKNFDSPYFSASIREFWSRWHISLSTWFRDYLYIPLGGSRKGTARKYLNLMITFMVSGLWHGAGMTFILWGLIHGAAQVIEYLPKIKRRDGAFGKITARPIRVVLIFIFCTAAWVFFRAGSFRQAVYFFSHMADGITAPVQYLRSGFKSLGMGKLKAGYIGLSLIILSVYDFISLSEYMPQKIAKLKTPVRYALYFALIAAILLLHASQKAAFIYFQF